MSGLVEARDDGLIPEDHSEEFSKANDRGQDAKESTLRGASLR